MSDRKYGMEDCPFPTNETEYRYNFSDAATNFELEVGIGKEGDKWACESYIDVNADLGGAYPLSLAVKQGGQWHALGDVTALRVIIHGQYERDALRVAIQRAGLMTLPVYGTMKSGEERWIEEQEDALRKQTKTV